MLVNGSERVIPFHNLSSWAGRDTSFGSSFRGCTTNLPECRAASRNKALPFYFEFLRVFLLAMPATYVVRGKSSQTSVSTAKRPVLVLGSSRSHQ